MEENNSSNGDGNGNGNGECSRCSCHCNKTVSFPPGYKFNPTDEELVVEYLKKKLMKQPLPFNYFMRTKIMELNIYKKVENPEMLAGRYKLAIGEKDWYFFTPRDRKYPNGNRPNRAAGIGYWKATGADKPVNSNNVIVGYRKSLVFYVGKPPKGEKTNWIMHEFRLDAPARKRTSSGDMKLDDWVLCRIYKKPETTKSEEEVETSVVTEGQSPPVESALDQNQIHQGGNNDDQPRPIKICGGNVEMFKNRGVELHQSAFIPHLSYQTKLPLRNRSLAAKMPLMKNVHYNRYNEDQRYVPMTEINYLFQPQQQQQQQQQQQTVSQTVPPVYSKPPSMYQHVEYNPNYRADFHTQYTMDSTSRELVPQQPQHEWEQQQYQQQSHGGPFLPMEYNPEFDETSSYLVTKDEGNFGQNIPSDIPRDPPYD